MDPVAVEPVLEGDLRISRGPAIEVAAAAIRASQDAGLIGQPAEFLVVCVPPRQAMRARRAVLEALKELANE